MAEEKVGLSYPIEFLVTGLIAYDQVKWTRKLRREKPEEYERYTRNRNQLRYAIEILSREARADMVVKSANGIRQDGEEDNVLPTED
jgi:hypothetical protein